MADQATQTPSNPAVDMRSVFREELKPLQDTTRRLEETNQGLQTRLADVGQQLDTLETEVRAAPQMRVTEPEDLWTPGDKVLARVFYNNDGHQKIRKGEYGVQRAFDLATIATNGALNAQQADTFLHYVLERNQFLSLLNYEPMNSPQKNVDKLDIASRVIRKKVSRQKPVDVDVDVNTPVELSTVEYGLSTQIALESLEDNIMRGRATNFILDRFSTVLANDVADLSINGTGSAADGGFLEIDKGFIQLFTDAPGTIDSVSGAAMAGDVRGALLSAMRDAMPVQFRRLMPAFITSHKIKDAYLDQIENRPTDLGDRVLANGWKVPAWQGFPIVPVDFVPDGVALFTPLSNLVFGVQRNVTFGVDTYNVPRYADYGWTMRTDFAILHAPMAVLVTDFAFS